MSETPTPPPDGLSLEDWEEIAQLVDRESFNAVLDGEPWRSDRLNAVYARVRAEIKRRDNK